MQNRNNFFILIDIRIHFMLRHKVIYAFIKSKKYIQIVVKQFSNQYLFVAISSFSYSFHAFIVSFPNLEKG